jgi:hypothetical protein
MADLTQDPASTAAPAGASEGYRPLSLLALVGFLLALLFVASVLVGGLAAFAARYPRWLVIAIVAALVGGWLTGLSRKHGVAGPIGLALAGMATLLGMGGLVAFSGTSPWLLPWPVWLLVGVALLTCWLASSRIAASEGTLGGAALARWGIGLTLFFTLNYGAYLLSSIYAVRSQARECTDEFIDLLQKGKVLDAFVRTLPARSRPSGGDLRREVEVKSNVPSGPTGGAYSAFTHSTVVRLVQMFGEDAKYEKIGINEEYEKGGYQVRVTYRATTSMGIADFDVFAFGEESSDGAAVRRQWHIKMGPASLEAIAKNLFLIDEGQAMFAAIASTKYMAEQWLDQLTTRRIDEAYLATVAPDRRRRQAEARVLQQHALVSLTGLAIGGALQASSSDLETYDLGMQAFRRGSILDVTDLYPPAGSANEKVRQEIIARFQKLLEGEASADSRATLARAELPMYRRTGDTITISYPVQLLSREGGKGRFIEGDLEIVGPWTPEPLPSTQYRIRRLRLYRGQESADPTRGPKQ